jgi:FAD:protein FMN transferase
MVTIMNTRGHDRRWKRRWSCLLASGGVALLGAALLSSATSPEHDLERHEYQRLVMGTRARIVLYAETEDVAREAAAAAFARMVELDDTLTDWRPSELTRLSDHAGAAPVPASPDLLRILTIARKISKASEGAFDVTLGPLTQLWRETRASKQLPSPELLAETRARCGWEKLELDAEQRTVRLTIEGMRLDVGAIGKGYAADHALATLAEHGVTRALVDIGGDMTLGDPPPGRPGWRIAAGCGEIGTDAPILELSNAAIATSGDSEQFVIIDDHRYSHILDPRTGLGLRKSECVTVIAPTGALADALASAVSVRGIEESAELLERFEARAPQPEKATSDD